MASLGYTVTCFHKWHVPKHASLAPGTKLNFPDLGKPSREIPTSMPFFLILEIFLGGRLTPQSLPSWPPRPAATGVWAATEPDRAAQPISGLPTTLLAVALTAVF